MSKTILSKTFQVSAADLKRAFREEAEFKADRKHEDGGRLLYMANADSYVMARMPGRIPFIVSEKDWRALPVYEASEP